MFDGLIGLGQINVKSGWPEASKTVSGTRGLWPSFFLFEKCKKLKVRQLKLEQLERLRSEDTPLCPVITHTIDQFVLNPKSILLTSSYRIPSQKKVKAQKIRKICDKFKF